MMVFAEVAAVVSLISSTISLVKTLLNASKKTVQTVREAREKSNDPVVKALLSKKEELEEKEVMILNEIKVILTRIRKLANKGDIPSNRETIKQLEDLSNRIRELKRIKIAKLDLQHKINRHTNKLHKDTNIDITKIEREIVQLELKVETAEKKEAEVGELISELIKRLSQMAGGRTVELERLLRDFMGMEQISVVERHIDGAIVDRLAA